MLRIPDDLEARLEALASRRGKTKSAIAREVLSKGVRSRRKDEWSAFDLMRDQIGIVDTGIGDLASNPKHMEGFGLVHLCPSGRSLKREIVAIRLRRHSHATTNQISDRGATVPTLLDPDE